MFKLRGYVALALVCVTLVLLDPVQRLLVAPWARLRSTRRIQILTRWQRFLAQVVLVCFRTIGGAGIPTTPAIPGKPGTLILMNHQSVLDIPIVIAALTGMYPRIVTRRRYLRWIPLISHMVRLYQYPVVDPTANASEAKKMLRGVADAARTSEVPLAIFPEGTRTRDGEIGPFRPTGLKLILAARPWTVYVLVADGFWERAKLRDFLAGTVDIKGAIGLEGPFEWTDPTGDVTVFANEMRETMVHCMASLRATVTT